MNQHQRIPTVLAHCAAITATHPNMCAGGADDTRLCIYNYLKE